jgi:outer membrane protein
VRGCIAVVLCWLMILPVAAQTPGVTAVDRTPSVSMNQGFPRRVYQPGDVSSVNWDDSSRADSLIRAGNLYLSLQDAISLSLENNLDLEVERFGLRMATTDTHRAIGGGTVRGVPLSVGETPAGIGGPNGSPLLTTAATGTLAQSVVSAAVTDTQLIAEAQYNLAVTGTFAFSSGPAIPLFDPLLTAQLQLQHESTPSPSYLQSSFSGLSGNVNYLQGFSSGAQITGFYTGAHTAQTPGTLIKPYDTSSLGFTFTQPLLRGFGSAVNRRFIRIARNSEKISDYVFEQQVVSTVSGVVRLYVDLVSLNEDYGVKQQTLQTAQRLLEDNNNKVQQGTLAPIEATRAQATVAAALQDEINAEALVRQQELILKNVLSRNWGDDPVLHDARIIPTDSLTLDPLPTQSTREIVSAALIKRPELGAAKLQITNSEISLEGTRNALRPEIDLVGTVQNSGIAGPLVPGATLSGQGANGNYATTLDQILKHDYPSAALGINLTLPVRNRIAQADVARDELQLRQTQVRVKQLENQIRTEVEDTLIALQRTRAAYQAAVETTSLQQQSLDIEQEKFGVGLSTNFLVIQYQGFLAQAKSTQVAALDAYAKAKAQFERAAGLTLDVHNVSIDEALKGQSRQAPATPPATPAVIPPTTIQPR